MSDAAAGLETGQSPAGSSIPYEDLGTQCGRGSEMLESKPIRLVNGHALETRVGSMLLGGTGHQLLALQWNDSSSQLHRPFHKQIALKEICLFA